MLFFYFYLPQKLISNNFLDGDCIDSTYHINLEEAINNIPPLPEIHFYHRKLVDTIIENICLCNNEKDDNIQLLVISILLAMLTNPTIKVHDRSLITALRTFIHIYARIFFKIFLFLLHIKFILFVSDFMNSMKQ